MIRTEWFNDKMKFLDLVSDTMDYNLKPYRNQSRRTHFMQVDTCFPTPYSGRLYKLEISLMINDTNKGGVPFKLRYMCHSVPRPW